MRIMRFVLFRFPALIIIIALMVSGCAKRSISDSGYRSESGYRSQASSNPFYKGELSEFQILGINPEAKITQEEINRALESKQRLTLPKGSSIMLIQSGAMIPDEPMVKALEKYYNVSVFSGVPLAQGGNDYAMTLRLAAAKGGFEKIVAYWGILETAQKGYATKAVSWVPFVGGVIPDEGQEMRIRLKVAVIDVRSGQWDMFSPAPFQNTAASARYTRESSDQDQ
ncbi:MAG: aminopeptidase, partial [Candidatus Tectomicrobia bacterium]|nr:aminopeptidase [Candidatus Tectomicrobia bacterium]